MYADGKPIVEITDMALRLAGTNRRRLERLWLRCHESGSRSGRRRLVSSSGHPAPKSAVADPLRQGADPGVRDGQALGRIRRALSAVRRRPVHRPAAPPSLPVPGPDRPRWKASPGRWPRGPRPRPSTTSRADAWYFEADRQDRVPYAVLLEAALQSCGWLAAYMGSALTSSRAAQVPQPGRDRVPARPRRSAVGHAANRASRPPR